MRGSPAETEMVNGASVHQSRDAHLADRPQIIAIAGDIGGGKSTVGKLLAAQLGVELISTGAIQRRIAASEGKTSLELNKSAEGDPTVDRLIDDFLVSLNGRVDAPVVESRMAWHFVKSAMKVYLFCLAEKAAARIWTEQRPDEVYSSVADALDKTIQRRASEVSRFKKSYGVTIENIRNYDIVVDTTYITPAEVTTIVRKGLLFDGRPLAWVSPRTLVPTQGIASIDQNAVAQLARAMAAGSATPVPPIKTYFVDRKFHIAEGHDVVAAAFMAGITAVPATVDGVDDEMLPGGTTARLHVRGAAHPATIRDWERTNAFTYDFDVL